MVIYSAFQKCIFSGKHPALLCADRVSGPTSTLLSSRFPFALTSHWLPLRLFFLAQTIAWIICNTRIRGVLMHNYEVKNMINF